MDIINLAEVEGMPPLEWQDLEGKLAARSTPEADDVNGHTTWLTTLDDDGAPHVTAVGAIWLDGAFWFQTGATRKRRNLARDTRCALAVSVKGADVVIEGRAEHVTDPDVLATAARGWAATGWPASVHESGTGITAPFNAPLQGPAPWNVYRLDTESAVAVSTEEPGGTTRFRF